MTLALLISPNGLGHYKRGLGLLHALREKTQSLEVHLFCETWQIERLGRENISSILQSGRVHRHPDVLDPGIKWTTDPAYFTPETLFGWEERLKEIPIIREADLVISDNLVGILSIRPDALLMGSFLWRDVLLHKFPGHPQIMAFAQRDLALLASRPPMLGIADIAMEGVRRHTNFIPCPWFFQGEKRRRSSNVRSNRIAVLAGATPAAREELQQIVASLLERTTLQLQLAAADIRHLKLDHHPRVAPFGFQLDDFRACDLVLCRPGIGTVTDCLTVGTPMLLFHEAGNLEMIHNARRLSEMGVADSLKEGFTTEEMVAAVTDCLKPATWSAMVEKINRISGEGFSYAADWILRH